MMYPETLALDGMQQPYFRTPEFSTIMKKIEEMFLGSVFAPEGSEFIALTSSGTGAMDAAVSNLLTSEDKVLVINGGSFGARFSGLCDHYGIPHEDYMIPFLHSFDKDEFIQKFSEKRFTALLVNGCETSTGQLYDLDFLGGFCKDRGMLFIVDAVSAYLADRINMKEQNIGALITASQKALSLAPGISLVALSADAAARLGNGNHAYYFDFENYIKNQKRGQPPFTSAVGTILSLHQRLGAVMKQGVGAVNAEHAARAQHFRELIKKLPLNVPDIPLSSCCTPVIFPDNNAVTVYENIKEKYDIFLTPSGGDWKEKQLRVGHLGNLSLEDYDDLIDKLTGEIL